MRRPLSRCFVVSVWMAANLVAAEPTTRPARLSVAERLSPARLERFDRDRTALAARIKPIQVPYEFVRGTFHIHSRLSHDSRGELSEIIAAAQVTNTRIVGFTEHPDPHRDVVASNVKGWESGIFFMAGTECSNALHWPDVLDRQGLRFVSHPEEVKEFNRAQHAGMEIYNTHTDALDEPVKALLLAMILNLPSVQAHPEAAFAAFLDYPRDFLARFDHLTQEAPFTGIAANDSHQNQAIELIAMPDGTVRARYLDGEALWQGGDPDAGRLRLAFGHKDIPAEPKVLTRAVLDPYQISMRHVGTYLQINQISRRSVWHALSTGRAVIAFEIVAPLPEIGFWVEYRSSPRGTVGDEVAWEPGLRLRCVLPLEADIRIVRNGATFYEGRDSRHTAKNIPSGVYRMEAFVELAGERWPWVITNPIYVTAGQTRGTRW